MAVKFLCIAPHYFSSFSVARQFKTINYALSSEKCMDEGWTLKPESPEPPLEPAKEFFVQEPATDSISGKVFVVVSWPFIFVFYIYFRVTKWHVKHLASILGRNNGLDFLCTATSEF